jgi:hypothetical protein
VHAQVRPGPPSWGLRRALSLAAAVLPADGANKVLKIGFVGVTSGPATAWGDVRSMQTLADWWNSMAVSGASADLVKDQRIDHLYLGGDL